MPFEPLRFIHAADLLLGTQPRDAVRASADVRQQLMRLTFAAFENVVQACLDESVDFLVLTGSSFLESDADLQARLHLLAGLRRLDDAGIRTFVQPGKLDGCTGWRALPPLPESVTVFADDDGEPVAVFRDGRVIASIHSSTASEDDTAEPSGLSSQQAPFTIDLLPASTGDNRDSQGELDESHGADQETGQVPNAREPDDTQPDTREPASGYVDGETAARLKKTRADYVALGTGTVRRTLRLSRSVVHYPGCPHALSFLDAARPGCSLVEVDTEREIHCKLLPTASVRFHSVPLELTPGAEDDDLVLEMLTALSTLEPGAHEKTWAIRWELHGPRSELSRFETAQQRQQWQRDLMNALDERPVPHLAFSWDAAPTVPVAPAHNKQVARYNAHLSTQSPLTAARLSDLLDTSSFGAERLEQLRGYLDRVDPARIENLARSLGAAWFPSPSEEEAA